jgi:NAD(P)-dependent dehydrogenase (short-subunit alcohol dehydrogenase family)
MPSSSRPDAAEARHLISRIGPALRALLSEAPAMSVVTFDDSPPALALAESGTGRAAAGAPLWFEPAAEDDAAALVERLRRTIGAHEQATGSLPTTVLVKGVGMFTAAKAPAKKRGAKAGRAAGKVAVVTGAAQGFGLEIAKDLAAEGAHVVLLDRNVEGVERGAAEIVAALGEGRALALAVDVTSAPSVEDAMHRVVRHYGGLDLLVSNAGVLRAGSVKTQPAAEFELVTAVNYTGYFLCVQQAAPLMATQHLARSSYRSDIIQINSKSGLAGSNRNGAYAGSKFGGVGLTQSFALELVEDGIKVNSVCPGNFFDGPLWSDPNEGLFVQYLRSGKVPGARTISDVRKAYESKVPMGRGCTAPDVMKAIYYLMDQQYETGQALPVTGGQVMLH